MMLWTQSQTAHHATVSSRVVLAAIMLASGLLAEPSVGQTPGVEGTAQVSVPRANFRATCSMSAEVVATLTEGEEVEVLGTAGSWYRVRHVESGIEGCMHQTVLGPVTPRDEEELEERETELEAEREAEAREAELEAERERREAELEAREEETLSRTSRSRMRKSGWIELSYGLSSLADSTYGWENTFGPPVFSRDEPPIPVGPGTAVLGHSYDYSSGEALVGGGGFLIGQWGGGLMVSNQTYEEPADVVWIESDPRFHFAPGMPPIDIRARSPQDLQREETAVHLHGVWAPEIGRKMSAKIFAGPTYFRVNLDLVSPVASFNGSTWELAESEQDEQKDSAWGGHVGGDFTYYFAGWLGIGVGALFSSGSVEIEDRFVPEEPGQQFVVREVDVGGFQIAAGVRFRFGGAH